jgi:hypothetical protein
MAQTGYTPILIYSSSTGGNAPAAGDLTNSTLGSELAINIADGKLFYKDNANAVQVIGWKVVPATAGGTGQTSYTQGDLLYATSSTTLGRLADVATGNALISGGVGGDPAWGKIGLTTHVSGVLPVANGGTNASSASITAFNNITGYTASGATGTTSTNLVFSTSPSLTTPRVITSINDTNGNELIGVTATASAVNEITVANAATGNNPVISATGSDTNIGITLTPKGTGNVVLTAGNLVVANGKGIDFSATPGTGTSELFADYEEGTWTPLMSQNGAGGAGSWTSSTATGRYTRIGRQVFIEVIYTYTAKQSAAGDYAFMTGLPFVPANNSGYFYVAINNAGGADTTVYEAYLSTDNWILFVKSQNTSSPGAMTGGDFPAATRTISFQANYTT